MKTIYSVSVCPTHTNIALREYRFGMYCVLCKKCVTPKQITISPKLSPTSKV